jgi:hypothetical protein
MKQDRKDVERDVFDINGRVVKGAEGYDAVLDVLQNALKTEDGALSDDAARQMAIQVIRGCVDVSPARATS